MRLTELLQQPQALPTIPSVVHKLIDSLNRDDAAIEDVTQAISADPVLSAKLLRLANSSYYHVSRTVGTVDDAVVMLGFLTVRTLVIGAGVAGAFPARAGVDLKRFWAYSTQTAAAASWLARYAQCSRDHAFTVGLMHGLGHLVMHAGMPEPVLYLDKTCDILDARRADMEHTSFGYNHTDVTAALLKEWKLPQTLVDAVAQSAEPLRTPDFTPLAGVLHVAAWRARAQQAGLSQAELMQTLPTAVCAKLNVTPALILDEMPPLSELSEGLAAIVA